MEARTCDAGWARVTPCERDAKDAVQEVLRLTGGTGADVVIDTAGGADTMRAGIDMLRPGGRFCSFSLSHEPFTGVSAFPLYYKEVSIIGSRALTAADITRLDRPRRRGEDRRAGFRLEHLPARRTPPKRSRNTKAIPAASCAS